MLSEQTTECSRTKEMWIQEVEPQGTPGEIPSKHKPKDSS